MALVLLSVVACNPFHANQHRSGAVVYPQGWPVATLVAPPGSQRAIDLVGDGKTGDECAGYIDFGDGSRIYGVGFWTKLSYDSTIKHFDDLFKPLNYRVSEDQPGRLRKYVSPDDRISVLVMYRDYPHVWQIQVNEVTEQYTGAYQGDWAKAQPIG